MGEGPTVGPITSPNIAVVSYPSSIPQCDTGNFIGLHQVPMTRCRRPRPSRWMKQLSWLTKRGRQPRGLQRQGSSASTKTQPPCCRTHLRNLLERSGRNDADVFGPRKFSQSWQTVARPLPTALVSHFGNAAMDPRRKNCTKASLLWSYLTCLEQFGPGRLLQLLASTVALQKGPYRLQFDHSSHLVFESLFHSPFSF